MGMLREIFGPDLEIGPRPVIPAIRMALRIPLMKRYRKNRCFAHWRGGQRQWRISLTITDFVCKSHSAHVARCMSFEMRLAKRFVCAVPLLTQTSVSVKFARGFQATRFRFVGVGNPFPHRNFCVGIEVCTSVLLMSKSPPFLSRVGTHRVHRRRENSLIVDRVLLESLI